MAVAPGPLPAAGHGPERLEADVVVVGAGLAGLRAAQAVIDGGASAIVLEARERVGGRLLNATLGGAVQVDVGGQWMGAGHERVAALAASLGVETFPTWGEGRNLLDVRGRRRRYSGTIPRLGPLVLWDAFRARRRVDRVAAAVPVEEPWRARHATELDSETFASWLGRNARTRMTRDLLAIAGRAVWGATPAELSMLHVAFYVSAAGGIDKLFDTEGGAQQDRFAGGAQLLAIRLAEALGSRVRLGVPVRAIDTTQDAVRVTGGGLVAEGRRAIVAIPPALTARIDFEPPLPGLRRQLGQRMAPGTLTKCQALYETPFWRDDGLSGEALSDRGPATLTFDSSPRDGSAGVLLGFVGATEWRRLAALPAAERREEVIGGFVRLFGPRAAAPLDFLEQSWADEVFSAGGPTSNFGPGGWTAYGPVLRRAVGRVHWAGTETATFWSGYMEGALQSGERAAAEVLADPALARGTEGASERVPAPR
jgi:monoamine oxidase